MKKKILHVFLITLIIVIILLGLGTLVLATNINDVQKKKTELEEQLEQATGESEEIQTELSALAQQVNDLNIKINAYEIEIDEFDGQLKDVQKQVSEAETKLNELEKNYADQKKILENRIVAQYEAGETQFLDVLLNSSSLSEFVSNYFLISEIAQYDNDLLDNIESEKNAITILKETLKEQQESLKAIKSSKEKAAIALENTKVIKNDYVKQLSAEDLEIQKEIEAIKKEIQNLEFGGGVFLWPLPGHTVITSLFGYRRAPAAGASTYHQGVDIGAPQGASIIAVFGGVVTYTGFSGPGGYTVIVKNDKYQAAYCHVNPNYLVKTGQTVAQGDIIAQVGPRFITESIATNIYSGIDRDGVRKPTNGATSGTHLHFGLRENGVLINPLPFITKTSN